jgi:hypothetical protein
MLPASRRAFGAAHPSLLEILNTLASAREKQGRWVDAEPVWREVLSRHRETRPADSAKLADVLSELGHNLLGQSRWPDAESILRESLAIREKASPDDFRRFHTMSLLGLALLGQGLHDDAEPLIVTGYEGVKAREATIPDYAKVVVSEAANSVVRLYDSWGKPEQAAIWRTKIGLGDLPADPFAR